MSVMEFFINNALIPIGIGTALGFPMGVVTGWFARVCVDRRKAAT